MLFVQTRQLNPAAQNLSFKIYGLIQTVLINTKMTALPAGSATLTCRTKKGKSFSKLLTLKGI